MAYVYGTYLGAFTKLRKATIGFAMSVCLHEDQYTSMIVFRSVPLRIRNVSDKSCRENQNAYFMFNYFAPENGAFYEIM